MHQHRQHFAVYQFLIVFICSWISARAHLQVWIILSRLRPTISGSRKLHRICRIKSSISFGARSPIVLDWAAFFTKACIARARAFVSAGHMYLNPTGSKGNKEFQGTFPSVECRRQKGLWLGINQLWKVDENTRTQNLEHSHHSWRFQHIFHGTIRHTHHTFRRYRRHRRIRDLNKTKMIWNEYRSCVYNTTHLDHKTTVRVSTAVTDAVGFMCRAHKFRIGFHSIVFVQPSTSTNYQHQKHAMYCRERWIGKYRIWQIPYDWWFHEEMARLTWSDTIFHICRIESYPRQIRHLFSHRCKTHEPLRTMFFPCRAIWYWRREEITCRKRKCLLVQ